MARPRTTDAEPPGRIKRPLPSVALAPFRLDEGRAREARLGLTGNRHPVGDRRQEGGQIDRLESGADGELDAVSAGRGIRSVDGPPQRAGAPVIGIGDHEGGRGQTVLKCFNRQVRTRSREGRRRGHRLILEEQYGRGSWRWPMASLTRSSRAGKKIPLVQGRYVTVMLSENVGGVAQFVGDRGRNDVAGLDGPVRRFFEAGDEERT